MSDKPVQSGFVWVPQTYGSENCLLNGVYVGNVHWGVTRNDPKPEKGRMCLGNERDFEAETRDQVKRLVEQAVRYRVNRLATGLELSK
jgi:hypothetical protein